MTPDKDALRRFRWTSIGMEWDPEGEFVEFRGLVRADLTELAGEIAKEWTAAAEAAPPLPADRDADWYEERYGFPPPAAAEAAPLDALRWIESLHEDANGIVWTTKAELRAALSAEQPDPGYETGPG